MKKRMIGLAMAFLLMFGVIAPFTVAASAPAEISQITQLDTIAYGEPGRVTFEFTGAGVPDGDYVVHLTWRPDGLSLYGTEIVQVHNPWTGEYMEREQLVVAVSGGVGRFTLLTDGTVPSTEMRLHLYYANESRFFEDAFGHINFAVSGELAQADNIAAPSAWAYEDVARAISLELVPQSLQSNYTQATTRAEFAALAVALYETATGREIAGRMEFNDTDDINVQKMGYLEVVTGVGNDNFAPDNTLTREQAATMLARLADAADHPLPQSAPTFADNAQISDWAFDAVGQVQAAGIMGGTGDNNFSPGGYYTREQSIVTIMRLFDILD
ncbi:MAG: S-layer homology domain-containing protein [Clostridiales bacterium]|jgi:hypothetical protein|nr:S-layer homology domain-containing protein [Clostridiales bacterium]